MISRPLDNPMNACGLAQSQDIIGDAGKRDGALGFRKSFQDKIALHTAKTRNVSSRTRGLGLCALGARHSSGEREAGCGRLGHRRPPWNRRRCPQKLCPSTPCSISKIPCRWPSLAGLRAARRAARARITEHLFLPADEVANSRYQVIGAGVRHVRGSYAAGGDLPRPLRYAKENL